MPTAYAISVAAAALTLNPNDEAARAAMARALARAGTTANNNDTNTPEEKNEASTALWRLTNEDAGERPSAEDRAVCNNYVATHTAPETANTIKQLCEAVRAAKRADLRRYFQRYAEQTVANEGTDDDRHQEQASHEASNLTDPTDADEVKSAIDAIEEANDTARWLFDLDEYESNFGEIGPPKKKNRWEQSEGNDLPSTFRDMLRAVAESLDFEAISKRNAPDRDECARYLWDRIESELTSSAEDEEDRATWLAAIVTAWPDLDDAEGAAAVIWDAVDRSESDDDEDSEDEDEEDKSTAADDIAAAIAPRAPSFNNNGDDTP